jgi:hypothetical protein
MIPTPPLPTSPIQARERAVAMELLAGGAANLKPADLATANRVIRLVTGDFRVMLHELWIDRGLHRKAPLSDVEIDMAHFAATGPRRRGVLGLRGIGKTTGGSAALTSFRHLRDRSRQIIIVSKSEKEAKKTSRLIREWYDRVWFLKHLAPRQGQRDAATYFDVAGAKENRQPSLSVIGIDGQLESNRGHSIYPDDVETKGNTKTLDARLELRRLCREFRNILYPTNEISAAELIDPMEIVHFGTPKHEETLFNDLIKAGYKFQAYPIQYPRPDQKVISLAPMLKARMDSGQAKPGDYVIPHRFGEIEVSERRAEGLIDFSMESMLIADLGEGSRYPLRISDLIVLQVHRDLAPTQVVHGTRDHNGSTEIPDSEILHDGFAGGKLYRPAFIGKDFTPYTGTKAFVDPAGRGLDRTGLGIVSHLVGMLFIKGAYGLEGGASTERLNEIAGLCRLHNVREILVEDNIDVFNTYFELLELAVRQHFLEPGEDPAFPQGWKASCERRRSTGQKELRIIAAVEPVLSSHRVIIDPACLRPAPNDREADSLLYQLSRLTKERGCLTEDGKLDAVASCIKEWQSALSQDPEAVRAMLEDRRRREAVKAHLKDLDSNELVPEELEPSWIHR